EERWRNLVDDMEENRTQLFQYYNRLVTHEVKLPNKNIDELKKDMEITKERLESGRKPNLIFFLFKGKQTKYLFEDPVLNEKPISTLDDLNPLEDYIKYQELKVETARIFNGNMKEINHSIIEHS